MQLRHNLKYYLRKYVFKKLNLKLRKCCQYFNQLEKMRYFSNHYEGEINIKVTFWKSRVLRKISK